MIPGDTPAIFIALPLEAPPRVLINCLNSGEEERIRDWIYSHDAFAELLARALELAEEARG